MLSTRRTDLRVVLALSLALLVISCSQLVSTYADEGNAEVTRTRNLQFFEMTPSVHPPGNASVTRTRNLQFFEMTPVGPLSTTIASFTTTDFSGTPKTSFGPGNTVLFKTVIDGTGVQSIPNALVSVMVQDNDSTPLFIGYVYENIEIGKQITVYLGFQIPYDSILGDYTVKVNIFTLLPSQGGEGIGHAEAHFTVN